MARFRVKLAGITQDPIVQAQSFKVDGPLVVFYTASGPREVRKFAAKVEDIVSITEEPER